MRITKLLIVFVFLFLASIQIAAQCKDENCGLVVHGKVTDLQIDRSEKGSVRLIVKLDIEFSNEGNEPIILFKPEDNNRYWLGAWSLYVSEEDAKNGKSIFKDGYWSSVRDNDAYRKLAGRLDVKIPPGEYTKTLKPTESWKFADDFQIYFDAETNNSFPARKTWKEMQEFPSKIWLRIVYEISPWQIESSKPDLIRKLQKRWKNYGNVLVERKKEGRFNMFGISSEPMMIDFNLAKEKQVESK